MNLGNLMAIISLIAWGISIAHGLMMHNTRGKSKGFISVMLVMYIVWCVKTLVEPDGTSFILVLISTLLVLVDAIVFATKRRIY